MCSINSQNSITSQPRLNGKLILGSPTSQSMRNFCIGGNKTVFPLASPKNNKSPTNKKQQKQASPVKKTLFIDIENEEGGDNKSNNSNTSIIEPENEDNL